MLPPSRPRLGGGDSGIEALVRRRLDDAPSNVERFQALEQLRRERWLATVFAALAAHGIPGRHVQGLGTGPPLRPPGAAAGRRRGSPRPPRGPGSRPRTVLAAFEGGAEVDLQSDLSRYLPDRSAGTLLPPRRSTSRCPGVTIRVLAPADHLRLVCLHQLHHGSWRPLWLCDVAVLLEALPPASPGRTASGEAGIWARASLLWWSSPRRWLGARPSVEPPASERPEWFERAVRRAWVRGYRPSPERLQGLLLARLPGALRARWPDPLSSTLHLDAPFHGLPRLPIQVAELVRRGSRHAVRRWRARATEVEKRGRP